VLFLPLVSGDGAQALTKKLDALSESQAPNGAGFAAGLQPKTTQSVWLQAYQDRRGRR
jgi:hypothetical protein